MENLVQMLEEYKKDEIEINKVTDQVIITEEIKNIEPIKIEEIENTNIINLILFNEWVKKYKEILPETSDVKLLAFKSEDIDPEENLLFKAPVKNFKDGIRKKKEYAIDEANKIKVPDIKPSFMYLYDHNLFMLKFDITDLLGEKSDYKTYLKTYVTKRGIIAVYSINLEISLSTEQSIVDIPYEIVKIKNGENQFSLIGPKTIDIIDKIYSDFDSEDLQIIYPPFRKENKQLTYTPDVISWLLKKQSESVDMNHQIKIDYTIMSVIKII